MHIPKNYFHEKTTLILVATNMALFLLAEVSVFLGVDAGENPTNIIAYRDNTKFGQIIGTTTDLYQFAVFAVVVTVASIALSVKLYNHRRHLAVGILALNNLLLIITIIIFNALVRSV